MGAYGVEGVGLAPRPAYQRPTRLVCIGGGTGLPVVLRGLAARALPRDDDPGLDVTAVVAMSDDGGSSGRLRRSRGLLPPGDIRNCLVALSADAGVLREVFDYRFRGAKDLAGHAVGNLFIAALAELRGDFLEAVRLASGLLGARGKVLPSTLAPVQLVAHLADARMIIGERRIARAGGRIAQVALRPRRPPPTEGLLEAIADADLVVIGPGSLYSSVLPNLLVSGVDDALRQTRAMKAFIANLMTEPGETDGMSLAAHVSAVLAHAGPVLDAVLVPARKPSPELLARYMEKGSHPVEVCREDVLALGVVPIEADVVHRGRRIRHDAHMVARCLIKLARVGL